LALAQTASIGASESASTRDRIKSVAAELYVLRGHDGFSFGDIAAVIGTTRANIHHHFGNKRQLMDEVVVDISANAQARIEQYWMVGSFPLTKRLSLQLEDLRRFYDKFNPEPEDRHVWSPLSRLRHDLTALGEIAIKALEKVNRTYDHALAHAVRAAIAQGELSADAPVDAIVQILRSTLLSCPPMTQDAGSFAEVERLFAALDDVVLKAWPGGASPAAKVDSNLEKSR
jgi:AcrR family transcriptional regulator